MNALLIMLLVFAGYIIAYHLYGKFIGNRIFNLSEDAAAPSAELEDGIDYVPTKKEIIFGHHFTSIAGTGPIVGPAIAIIWGWVPALIWILVGSVVMGAVHDFGALIISMRNQGKSIAEYASKYVSPRTRFFFFLIVFLELWIIIAIFGLVIAVVFSMYPSSVFPVWLQVLIALGLGYMIYKKDANVKIWSIAAVLLMYITVVAGTYIPLSMPSVAGIPSTGVWTVILLIYAFIASVLPVTTLLQPRDYINSHQLVIAMALLIAGIIASAFTGDLEIVAPAVQYAPEGAPPLWPFLFITIACGAISGFHSLVSSGTSAKQVRTEKDSLFVGYGSMLMEGALATLVIIAVAAGIGMSYVTQNGETLTGISAWTTHYESWAAAKGLGSKIGAFVDGSANMIASTGLSRNIALVIMGVFVASFAGTTLDTATRIQRYVISELFGHFKMKFLTGRYIATFIAVFTALVLAFATGAGGRGALKLWPLFGATNQTLAALTLIVITFYLRQKGKIKFLVSALPAAFMSVMTVWALVLNQVKFWDTSNFLLQIINITILFITLWIVFEGLLKLFKTVGKDKYSPQ
ncbi:MAG TPA: carbon starvation protein A [Candidatus Krumholzibacteriaceae bacterium]|nr:carbon starvation protein A [Candidatus Krumholzibacteriaceae bacterium]